MTDAETGDPLTHERYIEYLKNTLLMGGEDLYFVHVEKPDGPADVCHAGNGPTSLENGRHIANMDPPTTQAWGTALVEVMELLPSVGEECCSEKDLYELGQPACLRCLICAILSRHGLRLGGDR